MYQNHIRSCYNTISLYGGNGKLRKKVTSGTEFNPDVTYSETDVLLRVRSISLSELQQDNIEFGSKLILLISDEEVKAKDQIVCNPGLANEEIYNVTMVDIIEPGPQIMYYRAVVIK